MPKDLLGEYAAKRKFDATPEPPAAIVPRREGLLLFVERAIARS